MPLPRCGKELPLLSHNELSERNAPVGQHRCRTIATRFERMVAFPHQLRKPTAARLALPAHFVWWHAFRIDARIA